MHSNPGPIEPEAAPRILGVDPGSWITGWGLIGGSANRPTWLDSGQIKLGTAARPLAERLLSLHRELEAIVRDVRPTCAAVESPFHGANARSALQLAHARGVILAVLAGAGLEVVEYTPATVKKSVTGNGRAPKEQVRAMVDRMLSPGTPHRSSDPWDALAVALCHSAARRFHELTAGPRRR